MIDALVKVMTIQNDGIWENHYEELIDFSMFLVQVRVHCTSFTDFFMIRGYNMNNTWQTVVGS